MASASTNYDTSIRPTGSAYPPATTTQASPEQNQAKQVALRALYELETSFQQIPKDAVTETSLGTILRAYTLLDRDQHKQFISLFEKVHPVAWSSEKPSLNRTPFFELYRELFLSVLHAERILYTLPANTSSPLTLELLNQSHFSLESLKQTIQVVKNLSIEDFSIQVGLLEAFAKQLADFPIPSDAAYKPDLPKKLLDTCHEIAMYIVNFLELRSTDYVDLTTESIGLFPRIASHTSLAQKRASLENAKEIIQGGIDVIDRFNAFRQKILNKMDSVKNRFERQLSGTASCL